MINWEFSWFLYVEIIILGKDEEWSRIRGSVWLGRGFILMINYFYLWGLTSLFGKYKLDLIIWFSYYGMLVRQGGVESGLWEVTRVTNYN